MFEALPVLFFKYVRIPISVLAGGEHYLIDPTCKCNVIVFMVLIVGVPKCYTQGLRDSLHWGYYKQNEEPWTFCSESDKNGSTKKKKKTRRFKSTQTCRFLL